MHGFINTFINSAEMLVTLRAWVLLRAGQRRIATAYPQFEDWADVLSSERLIGAAMNRVATFWSSMATQLPVPKAKRGVTGRDAETSAEPKSELRISVAGHST